MYKVMYKDDVIDVVENLTYVEFQPKNNLNLITNSRDRAFGIISSDGEEIFHLDTLPAPTHGNFKTVSAEDISEEEFYELLEKLKKEVSEPLLRNDIPNNVVINKDLEAVKKKKLEQLSSMCNRTIINGFDVTLTDGKSYHFDLTIEDQINLTSLATMLAQGVREIPYHASGELCRFYSPEDISIIVEKGSSLKTYHTTYYNSLKNYVNSLKTVEAVEAVQYGDPVPKKYRSEVMNDLLGG